MLRMAADSYVYMQCDLVAVAGYFLGLQYEAENFCGPFSYKRPKARKFWIGPKIYVN